MNRLTDYGFTFGSMEVTRLCDIPGRGAVIQIKTDSHTIQVSASPAGRSVRVFFDNDEVTPKK